MMRKGFTALRLPSLETVRHRVQRSKRLLINRRGDGVHSPFAFHFISKVVRNRQPFYCFAELAPGISRRERRLCELLFRTAHELRLGHILHLGASDSRLLRYLQHTGYTETLLSQSEVTSLPDDLPETLQLIILEDPSLLPDLAPQIADWVATFPRLVIACYTLRRTDYQHWERLQGLVPARLQIDLLDLQLAFYDERLTASSYKGIL